MTSAGAWKSNSFRKGTILSNDIANLQQHALKLLKMKTADEQSKYLLDQGFSADINNKIWEEYDQLKKEGIVDKQLVTKNNNENVIPKANTYAERAKKVTAYGKCYNMWGFEVDCGSKDAVQLSPTIKRETGKYYNN